MGKEQRDLLIILRSTPETLQALTRGLSEEQARQHCSPSDAWSVTEIIAHLVDTEQAWLARRVRMMRDEDRPKLPYYPDADYKRALLGESLAEFTRLRTENTAYLEALRPSEWRRGGIHERWGPVTITWAVQHIAAHDAEHLAQISRNLAFT